MLLPASLTVRPSRQLARLLLVAHGGALAVLAAIVVPVWIRSVLLMVVVWSAWRTRQGADDGSRIVRLMLRADGKLEFSRVNGKTGESHVHPHTTVTPQLTILLLRLERRIESLVLLPDSLNAEDFRKLRLWLRWRAAVIEAPKSS